jgi:hypothetical protein
MRTCSCRSTFLYWCMCVELPIVYSVHWTDNLIKYLSWILFGIKAEDVAAASALLEAMLTHPTGG